MTISERVRGFAFVGSNIAFVEDQAISELSRPSFVARASLCRCHSGVVSELVLSSNSPSEQSAVQIAPKCQIDIRITSVPPRDASHQ
jgi:hypothetical protein